MTNASGFFEFDNLYAGHYNITEVVQSGYTNTTPISYSLALSLGKTVNMTSLVGAFGNNRTGFAYVTNGVSNNVSVIDTSTNTVLTSIPVGSYPLGVAITPDGTRAYVT